MNRTYLQAIAILMGTAATTFVAAELRWEPESAGHYLISVRPGTAAVTTDGTARGAARHDRETLVRQERPDFR